MSRKIYSKAEIQEAIGYYYAQKICTMDTSLGRYDVVNVFNGRSGNEDLIDKVMAAAELAIAKWAPIRSALKLTTKKKAS